MVGAVPLVILAFVLLYAVALWGVHKKQGLEISKPAFSLEGIRR
jgi:CHASE1-domain containing sensor protein